MNIFESPDKVNAYFPNDGPDSINIDLIGQSNSGKAGRSVRLHERVAPVDITDTELDEYFRSFSGKQLYTEPESVPSLDGSELFGDDSALHWDYGCGRGERIIELAQQNPDQKYVGVDLHYRSLALGVRAVVNADLANVRFIKADVDLLAPFIPAQSAKDVSVLFPAPVPNKKHGFDGIPKPKLVEDIHRILEVQGSPFEFSTDSEPYFNYRMRQIGVQGLFSCELDELSSGNYSGEHPTRYQQIWEAKGIPIHTAVVRKK